MRLMIRSITMGAAVYAMTVGYASAQETHPNFSGVWVMDSSKTVVAGQFSAPKAATITMLQRGDTITQDREGSYGGSSVMKSHAVWGIDGRVWKNKVFANGAETEGASVLSWEKGSLVIQTTLSVQGTQVDKVDTWTMATDKGSVTISGSVSVEGRVIGSGTMVFVKKA